MTWYDIDQMMDEEEEFDCDSMEEDTIFTRDDHVRNANNMSVPGYLTTSADLASEKEWPIQNK